MRRLTVLLATLATVAALGAAAPAQGHNDRDKPRTVGYFTQWGIYGAQFFVKNLDTSGAAAKLTHINYAFGNVDEQGRCFEANAAGAGDAWADYQRPVPRPSSRRRRRRHLGRAAGRQLQPARKLKAKHPHLKVMISLGGWTWSKYFSDAALPGDRAAFVASCIDMYIKGNLPSRRRGRAGLRVPASSTASTWTGSGRASEGNAGNVVRPEDKANNTALVAEFRRSSTRYGRDDRQALRADRVPAGRPGQDRRRLRGQEVFTTWTSPPSRATTSTALGAADQPPVGAAHPAARPAPRLQRRPHGDAPGSTAAPARQAGGRACRTTAGAGPASPAAATALPARRRPAPATFEAGYEDYKVLKTCRPGLSRSTATARRARLALRRHHVLDVRRPGVVLQKSALHPPGGAGRRDGLVAGRRRRPRHPDQDIRFGLGG